MAITDKLRAEVHRMNRWCCITDTCFDELCDHIDAEHERRMADAELAAAPTEAQLSELGYVELPKDANGEPIHVGDLMKSEIGGGFCGPFKVVGYIMSNGELEPMDEYRHPRKHEYLHHHKQPTVEGVPREMLSMAGCKIYEDGGCEMGLTDEQIAEYAAKLRLAGDAE